MSEQRTSQPPEHATGEGQRLIYVMSADAARPDAADELDFRRLWRMVWQSRWLIAAITALTALLALVYVLFAKEWYTAEALLIPAAPESSQSGLSGQLGGLAGLASSLAGISLGAADSTEPLAVLRSRGFTRDFIEEHDLLTVLFA
ncbi:MAG TPA: Wzz/FepE/Etk N-terminal domain-containing protein, partial [Steroidobacter sp.]|nr:Wzz/FepE/Etk N-terminal domain-containing protein [Steroidobacter sp.]